MEAPRILVVDDSLTIRRAIELILRPRGYVLELATDGREALSRAAEFAPDLVLLDYVLPDMRGPDVCAALARMPATARTPVVLVSAKGASIRQAYQDAQNVVSYITKPFKAEVVTAVVANALARSTAARAEPPGWAAPHAEPAETPAHSAPPPATVEETFAALLGQLEEAIAGDLGAAARREEAGGLPAPAGRGAAARLGPGLRRASQRMSELVEHLAGGTIQPYRLRPDGSFASLATTLLEAHRSLCETAIALAAAGAPAARPPEAAAVVAAFPPGHPLGDELRRALEVAPEVPALVVDCEFAQLPYLVRLLAPRCVIVAPGCDATLDEAWRRARVATAEGTRILALGAAGEAGEDDPPAIGERLEDGAAVARLVGELALGAGCSRAEAEPTGLEIVAM